MRTGIKYRIVIIFTYFILIGLNCVAQPSSTFDTDLDGWNTVGQCPAESSPGATWMSTGGNPLGCAYAQDNSIGIFYWYAGGTEWKGDLTAYYDCYLVFDLMQNNTGLPVGSQVDVLILRTDDQSIVYNTSPDPALTYTTYIVPLNETGWTIGGALSGVSCPDLGGAACSSADMLSYLGDIKKWRIRAEYSGLSNEKNRLDNAYITCDPLILPVVFTSIDAMQLEKTTSKVIWSTSSEKNTLGFQIEKSPDGLLYDSIGFVDGSGTTILSHDYEFIDHEFTENAYYRLRQLDINLGGTYSKIVALSRDFQSESTLQIFPNPVNDNLTLTLIGTDKMLAYQITDIAGRNLAYQTVEDNEGFYETTIPVKLLDAGMYIITCYKMSGIESQTFQVIK